MQSYFNSSWGAEQAVQFLPHAPILLLKEWLPDHLVTQWQDPDSLAGLGLKIEKEMLYKVISETPGKPVVVSEDEDEEQNTLICSVEAMFLFIFLYYGSIEKDKFWLCTYEKKEDF